MPEQASSRDFGEHLLPHLNAAYNLARWLTGNDQDAEDLAQEAYLRALRFFGGFRGGDARAWLLKIVRNTCYTWLHQNRARTSATAFDEELHSDQGEPSDPATLLLQKADRQLIERALGEVPLKSREMLILRELEGLSYKEIAEVTGVPMGTVMSSLARARGRLRQSVTNLLKQNSSPSSLQGTPAGASILLPPMKHDLVAVAASGLKTVASRTGRLNRDVRICGGLDA